MPEQPVTPSFDDALGIGSLAGTASNTTPTPPTPAAFTIGDVVRHRVFPFRGVIFDVDPVFNNTDDWWQSIPEAIRPHKNQPFYHLFAENDESTYVAYVSQQNLLPDGDGDPVHHPGVMQMFTGIVGGRYQMRTQIRN